MAARRKMQRRRPAAKAVTAKDEYSHYYISRTCLGQRQALLDALGFQRLEPLGHGLQIVTHLNEVPLATWACSSAWPAQSITSRYWRAMLRVAAKSVRRMSQR